MCGIAAIFKAPGVSCDRAVVVEMVEAVRHRGPDDSGVELFGSDGGRSSDARGRDMGWITGLGHRRLAILDLSAAGHQPMSYRDQYWLTYNGELYNYLELRADLQHLGHAFRSHSDSEVILAAYAEWGPQAFRKFRGMWGFVLVDLCARRVVLCRDRMGIKPLYVWRRPDFVAVGSEIKQFLKIPGFRPVMNREAAARYLMSGYEETGQTFFRDIEPVPTGSWMSFSLGELKWTTAKSYWDPEDVRPVIRDPGEASHLFAQKLTQSVRLHLRSDVPVGCALSGGLDSSTVAVLIHRLNNGTGAPLHTFSAVFPGHACDETDFIAAVLRRVRAKPSFVTPTPEQFLADLDRFLWINDEPPGGVSQYAGYCVSRCTREVNVPVTLNGQGGDEIRFAKKICG